VLAQPCSTPVKSMVDDCAVQPASNINCTATSPVNATRLVQLANVAIDSHENALDCRVDSASLAQHDVSDVTKSEDGPAQSYDATGGSVVAGGQLSQGKSPSGSVVMTIAVIRDYLMNPLVAANPQT